MEKKPSEKNNNLDINTGTQNKLKEVILKELHSIVEDKTGMKLDSLENFVEAGGNSIVAAQIIGEINNKYSVELRISKILDVSSIDDFFDYVIAEILNKENSRNLDKTDQSKNEDWPLTPDQKRIWLLDQKNPGNPAFTISTVKRFIGKFQIDILNRSYNILIEKHSILRAQFVLVGSEVCQLIKDEEPRIISVEEIDESDLNEKLRIETLKPMNLADGNLVRSKLFKINDSDHILLILIHNIIADSWSLDILIDDLLLIYSELEVKSDTDISTLKNNFFDFIRYQGMMIEKNKESQLKYWEDTLKKVSPKIIIPFDLEKPGILTYQAAEICFEIDQELVRSVKKLATASRGTVFNFFYSAFAAFLYKTSGQNEFLIGCPIENRKFPQFKKIVGYFANILVMENQFSPDFDILRLMKQNHDFSNKAYKYSDIPLPGIMYYIFDNIQYDYSQLFQIMFSMLPAPTQDEKSSFSIQPIHFFSGYSIYEIYLKMEVSSEKVKGYLIYSKDLFLEKTAQSLVSGYLSVIEQIVKNSNLKIIDLQV